MSERVLVTGMRAPVAVDIARAFAAAGYEVHGADSVTCWSARWSGTCAALHRLPPPRQSFPAFRAALAELLRRHEHALIVPTCEEVFYVAAAAEADGYAGRVFAPPLDTLRTLHSKHDFARFAQAIGIAAPETRRITDVRGLPLDKLVLKPEFSRFGSAALIRPTPAMLRNIDFRQPWVAQQFMAGEEVCLWSAVSRGKVTALACYRPRWRQGRSAAFAFELVDCPAAEAVARRIAEATGMTGHLSLDLIVTPKGDAVPIECNPRAVSGVHLFDAEPALAEAILGMPIAPPPRGRLRYLAPAMLLLGGPPALAQGRLGALVADWRRGANVAPALGTLADAASFVLRGLARGIGPTAATTYDIEWNGGPIG